MAASLPLRRQQQPLFFKPSPNKLPPSSNSKVTQLPPTPDNTASTSSNSAQNLPLKQHQHQQQVMTANTLGARIIDGKAVSKQILQEIKQKVAEAKTTYGSDTFKPHLAIVQVGGREDSTVYVRMKELAAKEVGMEFSHMKFPEDISENEVCYHQFSSATSFFTELDLTKLSKFIKLTASYRDYKVEFGSRRSRFNRPVTIALSHHRTYNHGSCRSQKRRGRFSCYKHG